MKTLTEEEAYKQTLAQVAPNGIHDGLPLSFEEIVRYVWNASRLQAAHEAVSNSDGWKKDLKELKL